MLLPARICRRIILCGLLIISIGAFALLLAPNTSSVAHAQETQPVNSPQAYPVNPYSQPNVDTNVPLNQHTYVQSVFLEMMSATICQIAGIDPVNPQQSCLGVDTKTGKLGFASNPNGQPGGMQVGGLLGDASHMIGLMYTPTTSTSDYFQYLSQNFGLVKKTYAQSADGFDGLKPIIGVWRTTRNLAYALLIIAFIFIGVGVMLRIKIDPRTVMTIQNQIPRIIIAILLITFSYTIAAVMVDAMWIVTYVGINALTDVNNSPAANPQAPGCGNESYLSQRATNNLLYTPLGYVEQVFKVNCNGPLGGGIINLTNDIASAIGTLLQQIVANVFGIPTNVTPSQCMDFSNPVNIHFDGGSCISLLLNYFFHFLMLIIILIVLVVTLFKVWFELLKAYTFLLFYILAAPIWIVFGLLPGRPLGFDKWIRSVFVNLAVFPLTALLFVGAKVLMEIFRGSPNPQNHFIPPLVGNPNMNNFGAILAFGGILMAPTLLTQLRESMKVQGSKHGAAIGAGLGVGFGMIGAPMKQAWSHLDRRNPQTGEAIGFVARQKQRLGNTALGAASKLRIPFTKGALERRQHMQDFGLTHKGFEGWQKDKRYNEAEKPFKDKARQHWMNQQNNGQGMSQEDFNSSKEHQDNFKGYYEGIRDKGLAQYREDRGGIKPSDVKFDRAFKAMRRMQISDLEKRPAPQGQTPPAQTPTPSTLINPRTGKPFGSE